MKILGIESSCDDTSIALIDITDETCEILAEKTASQIDVHKKYGGVVPEIAGRKHAEKITPVVEEVMETIQNSKFKIQKPDIIAVTSGPGLITGLIVGVETAKTLSYLWNVPIVAMNHIEGHIHSVLISNSQFSIFNKTHYPILSLVASGGHTELILSKEVGHYEKIGGTRDDASGEAFDKVAKLLGLEYPGGPKISKLAESGNSQAIAFPRPMMEAKHGYDMSFAGLKTSALYWLRDNKLVATNVHAFDKLFSWLPSSIGISKPATTINDFCASYQQAITDVLVTKTTKAIKEFKPKTFILAGGVSANKKLRTSLEEAIQQSNPHPTTLFPLTTYAMDNAAMIAVAAYHHAKNNDFTDWKDIQADPNWKIYNNSSH